MAVVTTEKFNLTVMLESRTKDGSDCEHLQSEAHKHQVAVSTVRLKAALPSTLPQFTGHKFSF